MRILALEADPAQAAMIRHVAHDMVNADVTVVDSLDRALRTLQAEAPDVVLVPALLPPGEEADLMSAIRQLPHGGDLEMLITPRLSRAEPPTAEKARARPRWGWRDGRGPGNDVRPGGDSADETTLFAERLKWTLQVASERREPRQAVEDGWSMPEGVSDAIVPIVVKPQEQEQETSLDRQPEAEAMAPESLAPVAWSRPPGDRERRQHRRALGPFDGYRRGLIDTPLSIRDISEGGCFVNALTEVAVGQQMTLTVEVPGEHSIVVDGRVVHALSGFGFAVRFVDIADAARHLVAGLVAARSEAAANLL